MSIAIIVHGGAWDIPLELHADHIAGCRAATEAGWAVLSRGGTALDAVEAAVRVLEDAPVFDAGRGSHLSQDGLVELDAGIMDGATLAAGAVASVKRIANPISLARRVLAENHHVFFVGEGAERFAVENGIPLCDPADLVVERERQLWTDRRNSDVMPVMEPAHASDTVGAVAVDDHGNVAVGNSTGGTFYKRPGRVGDTPLIGCGLYADNDLGAAACTGVGEHIIKTVLAKSTVDQIARLSDPAAAAGAAIAYFRRRISRCGRRHLRLPRWAGGLGPQHPLPGLRIPDGRYVQRQLPA